MIALHTYADCGFRTNSPTEIARNQLKAFRDHIGRDAETAAWRRCDVSTAMAASTAKPIAHRFLMAMTMMYIRIMRMCMSKRRMVVQMDMRFRAIPSKVVFVLVMLVMAMCMRV